jgi:serine/threonine protein phosphatase PrpC
MSQTPAQPIAVTVAMDTDVGQQREHNQDAIGQLVPPEPEVLAELGQIFVLADGVGGLTGGDLASQYAVSTIIGSYYEQEDGDPPDRLARAIAEANSVIYAEGQEQNPPVIMATTVVVAVLRGRDLIIGSVGDSPAFLMRDAEARKLTLDHTVEELAGRNRRDGRHAAAGRGHPGAHRHRQ